MDKILAAIQKMWSNPVVKTVIVTAVGGAIGAIAPMASAGAIAFTAATGKAAITGAITAVVALYIKHPLDNNSTTPPAK